MIARRRCAGRWCCCWSAAVPWNPERVPFEISSDLNPALAPLAWLLGRWEGTGRASYPDTDDVEFGQQIDFADNGGDYLHYLSQTFELDDEGKASKPLSMETGFWRPQPDSGLEVILCQPGGYAEVWYGQIAGAKIELATDAILRSATRGGVHRRPAPVRLCRGRPAVDLRQGGRRPPAAEPPVGAAAAHPGLS